MIAPTLLPAIRSTWMPAVLQLAQDADVSEGPCAAASEHEPERAAGQPSRERTQVDRQVTVDHRELPGVGRRRPAGPVGVRRMRPDEHEVGLAAREQASRAPPGRGPAGRHQHHGVGLAKAELAPPGEESSGLRHDDDAIVVAFGSGEPVGPDPPGRRDAQVRRQARRPSCLRDLGPGRQASGPRPRSP